MYVTVYGDDDNDNDYDPYDDSYDDTGDSDDYYYDGDNCDGGCIHQMFCIEASEMV